MMTRSSRSVSSLNTTIRTWMATAARVRKSFLASAAPSGYQSRAAISTARRAAPKIQAQPCLRPKTTNSVSLGRTRLAGALARKRRARSSRRSSSGVELRTNSLTLARLAVGADVGVQAVQAVVLEPVPDTPREPGIGHRKDPHGAVEAALPAAAPRQAEVLAELIREEAGGEEPRGRHNGAVPECRVLRVQQPAAHAHPAALRPQG